MCATSKPLELRCHTFLVLWLTTRKCHNSLENHGRNGHHTFFTFTSTKAFWNSCLEREHHWSSHGAVAVRGGQSQDLVCYEYNRQLKYVYVPSGLWLLPTDLISWAVSYLPRPDFPPRFSSSCEEERILLFFNNRISFFFAKRCNKFKLASSKFQRYWQRNKSFNEATSSRFQQVSIQRTPHDVITPPPTRPTSHLYNITTFIVHDKTEGSWKLRGPPSLDPICI